MIIPTPINYRIYLNGSQIFVASLELPEITPRVGEIRGLGMSGTYESFRGVYEAIEMTVTFNSIPNNPAIARLQFDPQNPSQLQIRANQYTYTSGSPPVAGLFLFQANVRSKGHVGGELTVEDPQEVEITLAVDRLIYTINGSEIFHLDVLSSEGAQVNSSPLIPNL